MVGEIGVRGVSKSFPLEGGDVEALKGIDLNIASGSFISLIGPSGCGKSTLLRLVAGLVEASEGEITLDSRRIEGPGCERGFVFQEHTLFPWLNIYQNVAFGLKMQGLYKERKGDVDEWIETVSLKGFEKSFPHQLSGGMCQRASLARALVVKPKVLLLDEPLGALDAFTRMNMQEELLRIWAAHRMTMVMVTHDVDEAIYLSDRVVIFSPRPGRTDEIVDIELSRPRARNDEGFIFYRRKILGHLNFGGIRKDPNYSI
ncbi:MAG: ABC transporter ATP-binding protein [Synergistaceae bacterium]|nr:ABC transporter ATP-binding protein [Synergistaceae bacterium]